MLDPEDPDLSEDPDGDLAAHTDASDQLITVIEQEIPERLDKVLAGLWPEISRARIQALIDEGQLQRNGTRIDSVKKTLAGTYQLILPPPVAATPQPQDLPLAILHEDADLIVIDKAAGMAAHPAPGTPDGTLVNALLHHCAGQLSGIGGVARPGIVHRLDKDTSGVMVVAKSDAAHQGLARLFATHDIDRLYLALARNAPRNTAGTVTTQLGRSPHDRKKMAILRTGGRQAITHYQVRQTFGPQERPLASLVACKLETGRTHQIRVHLASLGCPCLADPVYGSGPPAERVRIAIAEAGLDRQALHASVLGFVHPVTGETLRFESPLPPPMERLKARLSEF